MENSRNPKKRIGIKTFPESKGATDCTDLITTNTEYQSQSYISIEYKSSAGKHNKYLPKLNLLSKPGAFELSTVW